MNLLVAGLYEFIRATNFEGMACSPTKYWALLHILSAWNVCCSHTVFSEEGDPKGQDVICLKGKADPYSSNRNFRLA